MRSNKMLRIPEVEERTGLSYTTLWRMERDGEFPPKRRLTTNTVGWLESEVNEWLESRPLASAASEREDDVAA